jgi:hypothetical protein
MLEHLRLLVMVVVAVKGLRAHSSWYPVLGRPACGFSTDECFTFLSVASSANIRYTIIAVKSSSVYMKHWRHF